MIHASSAETPCGGASHVTDASADERECPQRPDERAFLTEDVPDWMTEAIAKAEVDARHGDLDA